MFRNSTGSDGSAAEWKRLALLFRVSVPERRLEFYPQPLATSRKLMKLWTSSCGHLTREYATVPSSRDHVTRTVAVRSSWTQLCNNVDAACDVSPPVERLFSATASTRNAFYTFGGTTTIFQGYGQDEKAKNDLWRMTYDPLEGATSWLEICSDCIDRPPKRHSALMGVIVLEDTATTAEEVTVEDTADVASTEHVHSIYVFGGEGVDDASGSHVEDFADIWRIDVDASTGAVLRNWTAVCTDAACGASRPPHRVGSLATVGNKMFMFGAHSFDPSLNAVYAYDPTNRDAGAQWEVVCSNGTTSSQPACCGASGCPEARRMKYPVLPSDADQFYVYDGSMLLGNAADSPEPAVWAFNTTESTWTLVCSEAAGDRCAAVWSAFSPKFGTVLFQAHKECCCNRRYERWTWLGVKHFYVLCGLLKMRMSHCFDDVSLLLRSDVCLVCSGMFSVALVCAKHIQVLRPFNQVILLTTFMLLAQPRARTHTHTYTHAHTHAHLTR